MFALVARPECTPITARGPLSRTTARPPRATAATARPTAVEDRPSRWDALLLSVLRALGAPEF